MAYQTGLYTDQNDALDLFRAFLLAQGWTINDFSDDSSRYAGDVFTGKRLHVQKTINGTVCYFNFRSTSNQRVFEAYSGDSNGYVTGINVNGSTGYSGVSSWDKQANFTDYSGSSTGGCLDLVTETGGSYWFFADSSTASMVLDTDAAERRSITIGGTDLGRMIYDASGGYTKLYDRSSLVSGASTGASTTSGKSGAYDVTDGWFTGQEGRIPPTGRIYLEMHVLYPTTAFTGAYAGAYLLYSPDPFRGNAQIAPRRVLVNNGGIPQNAGVVSGLGLIDMTNYTDLQEITIGSDTYKLFLINDATTFGAAFKK